MKEARYRNLTAPRPRRASHEAEAEGSPRSSSEARQYWHRVSEITRRAQGDAPENGDYDSSHSFTSDESPDPKKASRLPWHRKRDAWKGKMMDLPYFLEMIDQKHRYGTNLRAYHEQWIRADTHENFFYWLDYGEGRNVDLQICSRERLDKEQIRYLSREERMDYLVKVDGQGRLCWMRNRVRIDTSEEWKDSIHGIVPNNDSTPAFKAVEMDDLRNKREWRSSNLPEDTESETGSDLDVEAARRYPDNPGKAKKSRKIIQVSPATIFNSLLRKSVKKNTWIFVRLYFFFIVYPDHLYLALLAVTRYSSPNTKSWQVADLSMNLYVGIKQSGAFQHSSFLHGSRISAAGLITIQDGELRSLSPLRYALYVLFSSPLPFLFCLGCLSNLIPPFASITDWIALS